MCRGITYECCDNFNVATQSFAFKRESKTFKSPNLKFIFFHQLEDLEPFPSINPPSSPSSRMSEQQMLVPNLDDIIAEIRVNTKEITTDLVEKVP